MAVQDLTKTRLLEAAGEEFAAKGFDLGRIRTICERADANLAAVNYHFGDKEQLYIASVLEAHRCGTSAVPEPESIPDDPATALHTYIHHFLGNVLAMSRQHSWHHDLMLREMLKPTSACETLVREAIRPRFDKLQAILRKVCPEAEPRRLNALAFSIIGQCLHYKMARTVSEKLVGSEGYAVLDLDFLTDHIAGFTLAALGLAAPLDRSGKPGPIKTHFVHDDPVLSTHDS